MKTLLLLVAAVVVLSLVGCGAAQGIVTGQAEVHVATQGLRFGFYADEDARCGELHGEDREAYRGCMDPARAVAAASDAYREILERAQRIIDAGDEDRFQVVLLEVIAAAAELARLLGESGIDIPSEVSDLVALGEQ